MKSSSKKSLIVQCVLVVVICVTLMVVGACWGTYRYRDSDITFVQGGNEAAVIEWKDKNAEKAAVYYRPSGTEIYTRVDQELIRKKSSFKARVDIVGLKAGTAYDFKIVASTGEVKTVEQVNIAAYDRSGFAHFKYDAGVGAYQNNGTPKDNALIVYVNEDNKNTVTAEINGKQYIGLVEILKHADAATPLIIRVIGTVGAATWETINTGSDKILPDQVVGKNGKSVVDFYEIDRTWRVDGAIKDADGNYYHQGTHREITQTQLMRDGFNQLDTSDYSVLKGLRNNLVYDQLEDSFDSIWNDCLVENVQNVTIEGIGTDARISQWGMTFKNCDSIEVRNLTFENYPEDALAAESSDRYPESLADFQHGNLWWHHNTFEKGMNNWCVNYESNKKYGDGSTDLKRIKNVTIAYNLYHETKKTGLVGSADNHSAATNITFHHNLYDNCEKRLPLVKQGNVHLYNNYYKGKKCNISLRANAYALIENCYFEDCKTPLELQYNETYGSGWAKLINCKIDASKIKLTSGVDANHLYVGTDRTKALNTANKFGSNFDTSTTDFYYDGTQTMVSNLMNAETVKEQLAQLVGVLQK